MFSVSGFRVPLSLPYFRQTVDAVHASTHRTILFLLIRWTQSARRSHADRRPVPPPSCVLQYIDGRYRGFRRHRLWCRGILPAAYRFFPYLSSPLFLTARRDISKKAFPAISGLIIAPADGKSIVSKGVIRNLHKNQQFTKMALTHAFVHRSAYTSYNFIQWRKQGCFSHGLMLYFIHNLQIIKLTRKE